VFCKLKATLATFGAISKQLISSAARMEINTFETAGCEFNARDIHDYQRNCSHPKGSTSLIGRQMLGAAACQTL
jgi:hypothetical protein